MSAPHSAQKLKVFTFNHIHEGTNELLFGLKHREVLTNVLHQQPAMNSLLIIGIKTREGMVNIPVKQCNVVSSDQYQDTLNELQFAQNVYFILLT